MNENTQERWAVILYVVGLIAICWILGTLRAKGVV